MITLQTKKLPKFIIHNQALYNFKIDDNIVKWISHNKIKTKAVVFTL